MNKKKKRKYEKKAKMMINAKCKMLIRNVGILSISVISYFLYEYNNIIMT